MKNNIEKAQKSKYIKSKLTITNSPFTTQQLLKLLQKTPSKHIYRRPAKGGGEWEYVTGVYIKKVLNYTFGFLWSTDILDIREKHNQIQVTIKLTVHKPDGSPIIWKTDIGKKDIAFRKNTQIPLDYGNDEKSAVTDGLKRCAAQFGIASDVYGKEEFKEIQLEKMLEEYNTKKEIPVSENDSKPATTAQLETIKKLGGSANEKMTQKDAKEALSELLEAKHG